MESLEIFKGKNEQKYSIESLKIKEQLESQIQILLKLGIIENSPDSKEPGIQGIDGKKYPLPKPEEIMKRLNDNKEIVQMKMEQGFTRLILEPFAYSLDTLTIKYKEVILEHFKNHKLFATKDKSTDLDEIIALDVNQPIWIAEDEFYECDKNGKIVYFPTEFSENHGGKTKRELLTLNPKDAWHIWLVEDIPNIPREGRGKKIGKRQQLETNRTPSDYLEFINTKSEYHNELGFTPEANIMYAITHLESTNQVINDYQGKSSISYQLGGYFPLYNQVPDLYWNREDRQATLFSSEPNFSSILYGAKTGVLF